MEKHFWIVGTVAFAFLLGVAAEPARATVIAEHLGNTDPTTEGFRDHFGNSPAPGSPSGGAWNISGAQSTDYAQYALSPSDILALTAAPTWTLTATLADLAPFGSSLAGEAGSAYADIILNGKRFNLTLNADGSGGQLLDLQFTGQNPSYDIPGLGTNSVTLSLVFNTGTGLADAYVNGVDVISGFAGAVQAGDLLLFGGVNANFTSAARIGIDPPLSFSISDGGREVASNILVRRLPNG
jgi:hypothetical protein